MNVCVTHNFKGDISCPYCMNEYNNNISKVKHKQKTMKESISNNPIISTFPCYECGWEYNQHSEDCRAKYRETLEDDELLNLMLEQFKNIMLDKDFIYSIENYKSYSKTIKHRMEIGRRADPPVPEKNQ